jgi:hypothetical protein
VTGTVIIRAPNRLVQIHRAQLAEVEIDDEHEPTIVRWRFIGDSEWNRIDVDVPLDDDDETEYATVAHDLFLFAIADVRRSDVTLTWCDNGNRWEIYYAPEPYNAKVDTDLHEDLVGYGSLGR